MTDRSTKRWVLWFSICIIIAILAGYLAYQDPLRYVGIVDLLASIISILVGVSLAVTAVLMSPFSVSAKKVGDEYEAERLTKVVAGDDESFALGQFLLFGMFLLTLFFALVCKWLVFGQVAPIGIASRSLSAISAATAIFSLLWSVRLPFMLSLLAQQRKTLN